MAKMYLAFLLDFFQPTAQSYDVIDRLPGSAISRLLSCLIATSIPGSRSRCPTPWPTCCRTTARMK